MLAGGVERAWVMRVISWVSVRGASLLRRGCGREVLAWERARDLRVLDNARGRDKGGRGVAGRKIDPMGMSARDLAPIGGLVVSRRVCWGLVWS